MSTPNFPLAAQPAGIDIALGTAGQSRPFQRAAVPLAIPAQQSAPDPTQDIQPIAPVSADNFASNFLSYLTAQTAKTLQPPTPPPGAGSFADKLNQAISGIGRSMGDASQAAKEAVPGEAGIGVIGRVFANRANREQAQADAAREKARQDTADAQASARNALAMAEGQKRIQALDDSAQEKVYTSNRTASQARSDAGFQVEHGVTDPDLQSRIQNFNQDGKHFTDVFDILPVGTATINGQKVATYDIVRKTAEKVKPTDDERAFIKRYTGNNIPEGTEIPNNLLTSLRIQAQTAQTVEHQLEKANSESLTDEQNKLLASDKRSPAVVHALTAYPDDPVRGMIEGIQTAQAHIQQGQQLLDAAKKHGDQAAITEATSYLERGNAELKSLQNVAQFGLTPEAIKQHETIQHDRAEEANKRAEIAKKGSGDSGEVSPGDAALAKQIYEGRSEYVTARTKEGQRIAKIVAETYPDYDETKGKVWGKTRNEYMGSGATAKKVVAYNTAMSHMKDLYDNTTLEGIMNPASDAYQKRQVALGYVANEVGSAIKTGVLTEGEGKDILNRLQGGLTPGLKRERIKETASLLHDKVEEFQNKFNDAAPSPGVQVPILLSPKAAAAYDYVQSDGTVNHAAQNASAPQNAPTQNKVFSARAWQQANPNGDVNAAVAAAKAQGYQVAE